MFASLLGLNFHFQRQWPCRASAPAQDGSAWGGEACPGLEGQDARSGGVLPPRPKSGPCSQGGDREGATRTGVDRQGGLGEVRETARLKVRSAKPKSNHSSECLRAPRQVLSCGKYASLSPQETQRAGYLCYPPFMYGETESWHTGRIPKVTELGEGETKEPVFLAMTLPPAPPARVPGTGRGL